MRSTLFLTSEKRGLAGIGERKGEVGGRGLGGEFMGKLVLFLLAKVGAENVRSIPKHKITPKL